MNDGTWIEIPSRAMPARIDFGNGEYRPVRSARRWFMGQEECVVLWHHEASGRNYVWADFTGSSPYFARVKTKNIEKAWGSIIAATKRVRLPEAYEDDEDLDLEIITKYVSDTDCEESHL